MMKIYIFISSASPVIHISRRSSLLRKPSMLSYQVACGPPSRFRQLTTYFRCHASLEYPFEPTMFSLAIRLLLPLFVLSTRANPITTKPEVTTFTSNIHADVSIRFVTDSGVCETTPGVHQMSGYVDVGTNMSMVNCLVFHIHDISYKISFVCSGFGFSKQENLRRLHRLLSGKSDLCISVSCASDKASQVEWRSWLLLYDRTLPRHVGHSCGCCMRLRYVF